MKKNQAPRKLWILLHFTSEGWQPSMDYAFPWSNALLSTRFRASANSGKIIGRIPTLLIREQHYQSVEDSGGAQSRK
jgi:hypothetical protein